MCYQKLTIVGNLGRDPEMRFLPDGRAVTNLSVATNRTWKDANGQQVKETTWFKVSVWGKMAEACAEYLQKGRLVLVEGRLSPDKQTGGPRIWEKKDGSGYGASFEVFAETIKFLPGGNGNGNGGGSGKQRVPNAGDFEDMPGGEPATSVDGWGDDDDGIPI